MYYDDSQFIWHNMFEENPSTYDNRQIAFSNFDATQQCGNELLLKMQQHEILSSYPGQENQKDLGDFSQYLIHQLSRTQVEEPPHQIFKREESTENPKKGSTDCQNSPKLMSKVICQLLKGASAQHYFSDQARQYVKFGITKLQKNPTIKSFAQFLVEIPQQLKNEKKKPSNPLKFNFSLLEMDLKNYQNEVRLFLIERRQECLRMASEREIQDVQRMKCFIKYIEAFIQNLVGGVVKRKLKKF